MRYFYLFISLLLFPGTIVLAQKKIRFPATDSLPVTADVYTGNPSNPYILLFHQENSSRGEYSEIAPRLVKMGFNCLAVDLRSGDEYNFVNNETARTADSLGMHPTLYDCLKDIEGAIQYTLKTSYQPVVLLGSSFSASLALLAGKENGEVSAVMAFSPGEFFLPGISVKNSLIGFSKPVFIAGTRSEAPYIEALSENISEKGKRIFTPGELEGEHGARALLKTDPAFREYWLAVIMFIRSIHQE